MFKKIEVKRDFNIEEMSAVGHALGLDCEADGKQLEAWCLKVIEEALGEAYQAHMDWGAEAAKKLGDQETETQ
jgi:hypothetical protein